VENNKQDKSTQSNPYTHIPHPFSPNQMKIKSGDNLQPDTTFPAKKEKEQKKHERVNLFFPDIIF
jgi:hypothetical protein